MPADYEKLLNLTISYIAPVTIVIFCMILFQDFTEMLRRHPQGKAIIREHAETKCLSARNRKILVAIAVNALVERHSM